MYRIKVILFLISMIQMAFPLAIEAQDQALTLEECLSIALQENPLLLSSLEQYKASQARVQQAKAFAQPSFDFDSDLQPRFFDFAGAEESYAGISQSFEFPGKRQLRGKIALKESQEFASDIDLLKLELVFQVKQAFYGVLVAQEIVKHGQENLELALDFLIKAEFKYSTGDVAQVEVLRAKVEASKAENELKVARNEERLAKARLNFLLARKKYAPLEVKGSLKRQTVSLDLEMLKQIAFSFRPEIKKIGFSLERESLRKTQGQMSYLPDFELGVSRHRLEGLPTTWDVTLSFTIPLFFWQPSRGEIAEAAALTEALKRELDHLQNSIGLEVEEAFLSALTAGNQIELFEKEILTQAEEVYNMYLFSYQEGEIGGIELIEARRTLIEARKSYADALYSYDLTLAALERSIAQALEGGTDD